MNHVGLDLHLRTSTLCILDENGREVKTVTRRTDWPGLLEFMNRELPKPFDLCYEASCGAGEFYDHVSKIANSTTVAHPGKLRLIYSSQKKNDRIDAQRLAKLLYMKEVPSAYIPPRDIRIWRETIESRQALVNKRTATKNQIRALLRSRMVTPPQSLFSRQGVQWLQQLALGDEWSDLRLELLVGQLQMLDLQIRHITKALDKRAAKDPGVILLRTIPGVGPRTAEAVVAYIADPRRFRHSAQIGAYVGLVPCEDSSAGRKRLGHITRQGPATVRKLLTEAAWQVIRRDETVRAWFERISQGRKERRKIALVAIARRLAVCMLAMLRTGEVWRSAA